MFLKIFLQLWRHIFCVSEATVSSMAASVGLFKPIFQYLNLNEN